MDSKTYSSILKTVCYADIFDYPLTEEEVGRFICHPERSEGSRDFSASYKNDMRGNIKRANGVIAHKNTFMFLKGREELIAQRLEREKTSRKKLEIAKRIASLLKYIPTIRLVGVSGGVAIENAEKDDDIDFFIIAKTNTIWLTRLLTMIVVELFGRRRRPGDTNVADKICLNMFMDENFLSTLKEKRNIYMAHEICQLKVLYNSGNTYQKFLNENRWVARFLPKAVSSIKYQVTAAAGSRNGGRLVIKKDHKISSFIIHHSSFIFEWLAKRLQLWYMRRRRTSEVISDHYLAFHPKDYTNDVLTAFKKKIALYGAQV